MAKFTMTLQLLAASFASITHVVSAQPYTDCDITTYYSSLLPASSTPLLASRADMHNLIKNTHRNELPYTSSAPDVWDAMIALDGDTGDESGNVKLIYGDRLVSAVPYDQGTCEYWNREHVWSRSLGVSNTGKDNTDVHHLRPCDCNVNSARSNLYFGACGTVVPFAQCTSPAHPEAAVDTEKDSATFLPPADRRGDVARAILYMDLRYDGDEPSTSNLVVSDCPETVANGAGMGYLSQLLQWHLEDPPDAYEIQRNLQACTNWQGNRNPFVDYPQLASTYHGGSRPLLGDGLGYDCSIPPPPPGTTSPTAGPTPLPPGTGICSDEPSQTCTATAQCQCASGQALSGRNLRGINRKLQTSSLMISGVFDGPLAGGLPKLVELYALDNIADLSSYGIGSANNGGGTDGQEFTLSGSATAGSFITVASESMEFNNYFGETPTFTAGAANINGDDAIELFFNGGVADTFGDISVDGTGQPWEYMDGWAYRQVGSSPGGSSFQIGEWQLSGANAVDGCSTNGSCGSAFPSKSFLSGVTGSPSTSPTSQPTKSPTPCACIGAGSSSPSASPSKAPSSSPNTASPSTSPTVSPTLSPQLPTNPPSTPPSTGPTTNPSRSPSKLPTLPPTNNPTTSPTLKPTVDCSLFTSRKSCRNAGCSWGGRPKTCSA